MDGVSSAVRAERLECGVLRVRDLNRPKRIRCALRAGQTAPICHNSDTNGAVDLCLRLASSGRLRFGKAKEGCHMAERYDVVLDGQLGERRGTRPGRRRTGGSPARLRSSGSIILSSAAAAARCWSSPTPCAPRSACCAAARTRSCGAGSCAAPSPPAAAASASAGKNRRKGQRDDLSAKSRLSGALSAEGLL